MDAGKNQRIRLQRWSISERGGFWSPLKFGRSSVKKIPKIQKKGTFCSGCWVGVDNQAGCHLLEQRLWQQPGFWIVLAHWKQSLKKTCITYLHYLLPKDCSCKGYGIHIEISVEWIYLCWSLLCLVTNDLFAVRCLLMLTALLTTLRFCQFSFLPQVHASASRVLSCMQCVVVHFYCMPFLQSGWSGVGWGGVGWQ